MSKTESQLLELTEIAKQFKAYSRQQFGWDTREFYGDGIDVRCYFADESDHSSVMFGRRFDDGIGVSFFSEPNYELTMKSIKNLATTITKAKALLATLKDEQAKESTEEVERRKAERKKVLLAELEEL